MTSTVGSRSSVGRVSARVFEALWIMLGVVAIGYSLLELHATSSLFPGARKSLFMSLCFGVIASVAAIADAVHKPTFRFVGLFAGGILSLYGLALIVLGSEDVGGLGVSLPFGCAAIALGGWAVVRAVRRQRS